MSPEASSSTMSERAAPLCPPKGSRPPSSRISFGSSVSRPSRPVPVPSGTLRPAPAVNWRSPCDIEDVAKSITSGRDPATGEAKAKGLVPSILRFAPRGITDAPPVTMVIPISPRSAKGSRSGQSELKWCESLVATTATPASAIADSIASPAATSAGCENPLAPSTRMKPAAARSTIGTADPSAQPPRSEAT